MKNRQSIANFLQGIPFFVRSANIDIIITDIIGGNSTSAPIYWRGHVYILNRQGGSNLQEKYSNIGGLHGIAYLKSQLDVPILLAQL